MKKSAIFILLCLLFLAGAVAAQHRGKNHRHPHKRVVVKRSVYRPAKVVVFHPHWRPAYAYHRRWVYFPRRNFYWDNWRNHYVFWSGGVWVSQAAVPPALVNVNLEKEKQRELPEENDDVDDVYKSNQDHQRDTTDQ